MATVACQGFTPERVQAGETSNVDVTATARLRGEGGPEMVTVALRVGGDRIATVTRVTVPDRPLDVQLTGTADSVADGDAVALETVSSQPAKNMKVTGDGAYTITVSGRIRPRLGIGRQDEISADGSRVSGAVTQFGEDIYWITGTVTGAIGTPLTITVDGEEVNPPDLGGI